MYAVARIQIGFPCAGALFNFLCMGCSLKLCTSSSLHAFSITEKGATINVQSQLRILRSVLCIC